jgi:hypothetical protein
MATVNEGIEKDAQRFVLLRRDVPFRLRMVRPTSPERL